MAKAYWVSCYQSIDHPDKLAANAAHDGPGYQEALRVLGDAVKRDFRIVEGVG
jgi:uncharacterized protein (DUF1330 family)